MGRLDAVIFDLDGTLVRYHGVTFESSWGAVAAAAGIADRSQALFKEYFPRRDAYAEWVAEEAKLYAGISVQQVTDEVLPAPYAQGVIEAVGSLRGQYTLGILSSGVELVATHVADELGFDFAWANCLCVEDGVFTGKSMTNVQLWAKGEMLDRLANELGLDPAKVCFVGDNINDLPVFERVALAVAANPKDERVRAAADHVITDFACLPDLIRAYENEQR